MQTGAVKRWIILFSGVLCAILIADALSGFIVSLVGAKGWVAFIVSFVLYAVIFFGALAALKKYGHSGIFSWENQE